MADPSIETNEAVSKIELVIEKNDKKFLRVTLTTSGLEVVLQWGWALGIPNAAHQASLMLV